jgi:Nucleotidyl transferase AbiEii toxin, Type IV TA system
VIDWPWRSPEATRRALADIIAHRYDVDQRPRRMREIAYRRLLHRLFAFQPERWMVKGGAALLLRLDPNRTSNDIDLTYLHEAAEHAIALRALRDAAAIDLDDFFSFDIGSGTVVDPEHPLERALAVPVVSRIGATVFSRFNVDLALPRMDVASEWLDSKPPLTGVPAVDDLPPIATLVIPAQLADKTCALFERFGANGEHYSSRARDLADIAMIASQLELDGSALMQHLRAEEARRIAAGTLTEPLPPTFELAPTQQADWRQRWDRATRGAPISFDDARALAARLLDPVLAGEASGSWSADQQRWSRAL